MKNKAKILQASQELFFRHGIRRVTMDDIAKHLGMSKKTLYASYPDKDKIVNSLMDFYLDEREHEFHGITNEADDPIMEILMLMKHMEHMFTVMNPNLFYDMQKYYPETWAKFRKFKQECVLDMVAKNMKKGIKQGLYRKHINIDVLSLLRVEQVELAMNPDVFSSDRFNISEVQLALLDHFLHGITTIEGHHLIVKYKKKLNFKSLK